MFKKIIAVLLAVLMITGLVGCGGEKPKDENKGNDKPKTSDTTDAPCLLYTSPSPRDV